LFESVIGSAWISAPSGATGTTLVAAPGLRPAAGTGEETRAGVGSPTARTTGDERGGALTGAAPRPLLDGWGRPAWTG
jgi:hypothetical protein